MADFDINKYLINGGNLQEPPTISKSELSKADLAYAKEKQADQWVKDYEAEPYRRTPWGPLKALDFLNRLQYPIANTVRRLTDKDKDYSLREYGKGIANGFFGNERSSFHDVFTNAGWQPQKKREKVIKAVAGVGADILTDPLTYLGLFPLKAIGKAAKLGKAIKIGDEAYNLTKLKDVNKARKILETSARAAGESEATIKTMLEGLKGVKGANYADDFVKNLTKYGQQAEKIELASNWAKQYRQGQRALINFEPPKLLVGADLSADIPNPLNIIKDNKGRGLGNKVNQKVFDGISYVGKRVDAGRAATNKSFWRAIPKGTTELKNAAEQRNLFKIGDTFYDLTKRNEASKVKEFLRREIEATGATTKDLNLDEIFKSIPAGAQNSADMVSDLFKTFGIDKGGIVPLKEVKRTEMLAKRANKFWRGVGSNVNRVSEAFNFIPEKAKMIRRYAEGASRRMGNKASADIADILGPNGEKILMKGLPKDGFVEIIDDSGNVIKQIKEAKAQKYIDNLAKQGKVGKVKTDYGIWRKPIEGGFEEIPLTAKQVKARRYEVVEALSHPAVQHEIRKAIKAGKEIGEEELKQAVKVLGENYNEGSAYRRILATQAERTAEGFAKPSLGISDERIDRLIEGIDDWAKAGGLDDMARASAGAYRVPLATSAMGHGSQDTYNRFVNQQKINPIQRNLELDETQKLLNTGKGSNYGDDMVRSASRNQTMFESQMGFVDANEAKWLRDNKDLVVAMDINGNPVYGRDILNGKVMPLYRDAKTTYNQYGRMMNRAENWQGKANKQKAFAEQMEEVLPNYYAERRGARFNRRVRKTESAINYHNTKLGEATAKQRALFEASETARQEAIKARDYAQMIEEELAKQGNKSPALAKKYKDAQEAYELAQTKHRQLLKDIAENKKQINSLQSDLEKSIAEYSALNTATDYEKVAEITDNINNINAKIAKHYEKYHKVPKGMLTKREKLMEQAGQIISDEGIQAFEGQLSDLDRAIKEARLSPEDYIAKSKKSVADKKWQMEYVGKQMEQPTAGAEDWIATRYRDANTLDEKAAKLAEEAKGVDNTLDYYQTRLNKAEAKREGLLAGQAQAREAGRLKGENIVKQLKQRADELQQIATDRKLSAEQILSKYDDIQKEIERVSQMGRKLDFSLDLQQNLANSLKNAENVARTKLTLQGIVEKFPDIGADGTVSYGCVRAEDILPKILFDATETTGENLGDFRRIAEIMGGEELVEALKKKQIPFEMVAPIEAMLRPTSAKANIFYKFLDDIHSVLKPFMLSAPATHIRNAVSSALMAWGNGDFRTPQQWANFLRSLEWNTLKWNEHRAFPNITKIIDGKKYGFADLWEEFALRGGEEINQTVADIMKISGGSEHKFAEGVNKYFTKPANYLQGKAAQATESSFRFAHFLNKLDEGMDFDNAMESVAKTFYDYSDLSNFEKTHLRRWFPFYTFFRKNAEANFRYLKNNPSYLSFPNRFARGFNSISEGDKDTIPMSWLNNPRNKWLADQAAYRFTGNSFMPLQNYFPQVDMAVFADPAELKQTLTGMLTPIPKMAIELAENKDSFTGRPISDPAFPSRQFMGWDINPYVAHALRPFRILDVANKMYQERHPEEAGYHGLSPRNKETTDEGKRSRMWGAFWGSNQYKQDKLQVASNMINDLKKKNADIAFRLRRYPNMNPEEKKKLIEQRKKNALMISRIRQGKEI